MFVAFGLFLLNWQRGLEREALRRCHSCGSLYGEPHNPGCQWKDR